MEMPDGFVLAALLGLAWAVLLFMSVWSLSVGVSKVWQLRKAQAETVKFAPEFSQFLEEDNLGEAIKLAESYKKSHVARVLGGALQRQRRDGAWLTLISPLRMQRFR